jgi:hypothetical protein
MQWKPGSERSLSLFCIRCISEGKVEPPLALARTICSDGHQSQHGLGVTTICSAHQSLSREVTTKTHPRPPTAPLQIITGTMTGRIQLIMIMLQDSDGHQPLFVPEPEQLEAWAATSCVHLPSCRRSGGQRCQRPGPRQNELREKDIRTWAVTTEGTAQQWK